MWAGTVVAEAFGLTTTDGSGSPSPPESDANGSTDDEPV